MKEHEEPKFEEAYERGPYESMTMQPDAEMGYLTEYALEVIEKYKGRIITEEKRKVLYAAAREANLKRKREREEQENKTE